MEYTDQWNWVAMAYGITYLTMVAFATSVAVRIARARRKLAETA